MSVIPLITPPRLLPTPNETTTNDSPIGTNFDLRAESDIAYLPSVERPNGLRLSGARKGVRCSRGLGPRRLKKLLELIDCQAGVANDAAHREGVDWVMPRNRHCSDRAFGTRPNDAEASLLQGPDRVQVVDARQLGHRSDGDFDFPDLVLLHQLVHRRKIFTDRVPNIFERFILGTSLRPATGKPGNRDAEPFLAPLERNLVPHA